MYIILTYVPNSKATRANTTLTSILFTIVQITNPRNGESRKMLNNFSKYYTRASVIDGPNAEELTIRGPKELRRFCRLPVGT